MQALTPGMRGIDFSDAAIDPVSVAKNGGAFIMRYSAGAFNAEARMAHKLCKPGELQAAVAAGLDFFALDESWSTRILESGFAGGLADGTGARVFWHGRGLNHGAAVFAAGDTDITPAQYDAVAAYCRGFKKGLRGRGLRRAYAMGLYAGTPVLREMFKRGVIDYGMRAKASSWSNDGLPPNPPLAGATPGMVANIVKAASAGTPAHIWQNYNEWFTPGSTDEDVILRVPCGSHLEQVKRIPPVAPPPVKPPTAHTYEFVVDGKAVWSIKE